MYLGKIVTFISPDCLDGHHQSAFLYFDPLNKGDIIIYIARRYVYISNNPLGASRLVWLR